MNFFLLGTILLVIVFFFYLRYLILLILIPKKYNYARELFENNNEILALKYLNNILKVDKGNAAVNWMMAQIYIKKNQLVMAQMYLYEIINYAKFTKDIDESRVRETLALLYHRLGDFNKALIQYSLLKKQNKLSPDSLKDAIILSNEKKNYKQIEFLLKIVRSLNFYEPEFDYYAALVDVHHARFSSAEHRIKIAMEKGYETPELNFLLGKIYFFTRKYRLALKLFENISFDHLNSTELDGFMAQCFYYLKDYDTTINILEKLLEGIDRKKNKFVANIEYMLGCAYEATGEIEKAVKTFNSIKEYAVSFQPVNEKLYFYSHVAKDPVIRTLLLLNPADFIKRSEKLLDTLHYFIKQKIFEDEKTLEYICGNTQNQNFANIYYFFICRNTQPVTITLLNELIVKARENKTRNLVIIAPNYNEESIIFAKKNGITVYDLDVYLTEDKKKE